MLFLQRIALARCAYADAKLTLLDVRNWLSFQRIGGSSSSRIPCALLTMMSRSTSGKAYSARRVYFKAKLLSWLATASNAFEMQIT